MKKTCLLLLVMLVYVLGCTVEVKERPRREYEPTPAPAPMPEPDPEPPYPTPHPHPHPTPMPPAPAGGSIVVTKWDVEGGNFFTPKAKISLTVHGYGAQTVKLYAVSATGGLNELQALSCTNGQSVYFNTKYNRGGTKYLEVRLYDNYDNLLAVSRRAV